MAVANSRLFQEYVEVLTKGTSNSRLFQQYTEVLNTGTPNSRLFQEYSEVLTVSIAAARVYQEYCEVVALVPGATITKSASNTLVFSQTADYAIHGSILKSVSNSLVFTQTISVQKLLGRSVTHTLNFTQAAARVIPLSASNTLVFNQTDNVNKSKPVATSNHIDVLQTLAVQKDIRRTINQGFVINQAAKRNIIAVKFPTNTLTIHQAATYTSSKYTSNALVFSQTATVFVAKTAKNQFVITQTVARNVVLNRRLNSLFQPFQTVRLGPNTFRRSLSSTITFAQHVTANVVHGATNNLVFAQSVTVDKVQPATDGFWIYQDATYNASYGRKANNSAFFVQTVTVKRTKALSAFNILSFEQSAKRQRVRIASAENILLLTQELVKSRYIRSLSDTITFTQDVDHERTITRDDSQALAFQQSVELNKVLHLSASNQLVFKNSFQKHIGFAGIGTIELPETQVTVVQNLVVLRGSNRAITLPVPEFDDTDAFTGSINIIRFKTGGRKVYKKDTERRVLDYTFTIQSKKFEELKIFIKEYNSKPFFLDNWKGEIWYVMFNTNPFAFAEESYWAESLAGKNKFKVSLSFSGVRLN